MELMLTSFGTTEKDIEAFQDRSMFYGMPPLKIGLNPLNYFFTPDYPILLICEKLVLNKNSFALLRDSKISPYKLIADTMQELYYEGFIELVDFRNILERNKELLKKMIKHDLSIIEQWIEPFEESLNIWNNFFHRAQRFTQKDIDFIIHSSSYKESDIKKMVNEADFYRSVLLHSAHTPLATINLTMGWYRSADKSKKMEFFNRLKELIHPYLSYVNANIILSNELGIGFHDWADFLPFYRHKFLSVGKEHTKEQQQMKESQKLFELSFPEFQIFDKRNFIKIMKDSRIVDLRKLVESAAKGEVEFDQKFARSVFKEVLGIEKQVSKFRKIISYVTIPVGFLPWIGTVTQKVIEEIAGTLFEEKLKSKYRWFYLISDYSET